jgi:hypothetical protein
MTLSTVLLRAGAAEGKKGWQGRNRTEEGIRKHMMRRVCRGEEGVARNE